MPIYRGTIRVLGSTWRISGVAITGLQSRLKVVCKVPIGSLVVPFLGLPYRILNMNHKKELLWSLWVAGARALTIPAGTCPPSPLHVSTK